MRVSGPPEKLGLPPIRRKDRKHLHMFAKHVFQAVQEWVGLYIVVMIANIDASQKLLATGRLTALKSSLKYSRKHVENDRVEQFRYHM